MNYLYPFLKSHPIETILLALALILTAASTLNYTEETPAQPEVLSAVSNATIEPSPSIARITVDVSGAVLQPDVYEVTEGARLVDVIKQAGGMADDADRGYIARNFNMARLVVDQEKIYVPSKKDIASGIVQEPPQTVQYLISGGDTHSNETIEQSNTEQLLININTATMDELDMLPGVGPTTAQKIIDNRPFSSIDELLSKKAVKQSVFEKIKDLVAI